MAWLAWLAWWVDVAGVVGVVGGRGWRGGRCWCDGCGEDRDGVQIVMAWEWWMWNEVGTEIEPEPPTCRRDS